ncbi:unnamed protein product, partial [Rotaria sordida]
MEAKESSATILFQLCV